ncbi:TonB-dependent receptor [Congregibacter sp.]|uniref:TonB-dependent receptor n=1 Tax=Congregibacter sp. TaxID=2744308 RepID=UPI003F6D72D9
MIENQSSARFFLLAPMAAGLAAALSTSALAQQPALEEVVVTAQKRTQSLSDVPISVSAVGGDTMRNASLMDLADLTPYIPNFQKSDTVLGQYLVIRGIGSGINQGFEQSVVQFVDDVPLGRGPLARVPFTDLERIEVLRGPQNVLFGKNAVAGALSMVTAKPTEEFAGRLLVEYEPEYQTSLVTGMISGPITDSLRGRLSVRYYDDGGYYENNLNGNDEANREDQTIRGAISWDITDNLQADLKVERSSFTLDGRTDEIIFGYANRQEGSPFQGLTYPQIAGAVGQLTGQNIGSDDGQQNYQRNTNIDEFSELDSDNITLTLNWGIGDATLTSVTAYMGYETDEFLDSDGSGIDAFVQDQQEEYDQFTQEIRLVSPGGETIDWIVGGYYMDWDLNFDADFLVDDESLWSALGVLGAATGDPSLAPLGALSNLRNERRYDADSETYAAFGQATWNMTDVTRLTVGARYTREDKSGTRRMDVFNSATGELDITQAAIGSAVFGVDWANLSEETGGAFPSHDLAADRSESSFTPSAVLEWDVGEDLMLYGSVATGFKAGGFDARGNRAGNFEYEDENVLSFEFGAKGRYLDGRLELNAALFHSQYEDLQVSQFDGTLGFVVGNAAEATSQGLELDGRLLLTEGLTWSFAAAYLDFEFDDYQNATCSSLETLETGATLCDRTGETNIFSPEWSASTSFDYFTSITNNWDLRARLDLNYKAEHFVEVTLNPDIQQDAYTQVNAQLALESGSWILALVGKNLTDEEILSFATDTALSGTLGSPAYTGYLQRPRTIAAQVRYEF